MKKQKVVVGMSGGHEPRGVHGESGLCVAVGMSGGVDSSLSAALLVEQGYDVTGVFLECWREPGCRTDEDRKDALQVALKLKIPFKILDFKKEYKRKVVDYFYSEYKAGRTPNPDVMCNKEIKFGLFYDWSLDNDFDFVATGHYARIVRNTRRIRESENQRIGNPEHGLLQGKDVKKDQSYFLYRLRQDQLRHVLFPIGEMKKSQVREEAKKRNLHTANKPDSQGICFIGPVNIQEFLREKLEEKKGEVVDTHGNVIGEHDGVWFYTVGQRHGFRLNSKFEARNPKMKSAIPPLYVIEKDVKKNRLVVGYGAETYRNQFNVSDVNWIAKNKELSIKNKGFKVRIRHGGDLISAKSIIHNSKFVIRLKDPQRGVAAGQSAVFYLPRGKAGMGEECVGGGVIG